MKKRTTQILFLVFFHVLLPNVRERERERERVFGGLEKSLAQTILSYFQCSFYIVIVHQSSF